MAFINDLLAALAAAAGLVNNPGRHTREPQEPVSWIRSPHDKARSF
jgi:hypothetical protein